MMLNNQLIILSTAILATWSANAKDFGTKDHTHQIMEQPFLQMLHERLQGVDMEKEKQKMERVAKERIHNPSAVENVKPAVKNHIFYYDPTYVLDEDAVLPCGKILHKAGTTINPLEHMDLNRRLFFIDSREKDQVKWLKTELNNPLPEQREPVEDRIILVGGSPLELEKELGLSIYFDQQGSLTNKFGIKHSPAVAVQDGLKIRINEINLTN
jgi:conjugal transfer pilus assembly protein TraW